MNKFHIISLILGIFFLIAMSVPVLGAEARFTATPLSGVAPLTVSFIDFSDVDRDSYTWVWDFGDGREHTTDTIYAIDLLPDFLSDSLYDIAMFQFAMLELSIDKVDFEVQWFEKLKNQLVEVQ